MIAGFLKVNSAAILIATFLLPAFLHVTFQHAELALENTRAIPWSGMPDASTAFNANGFEGHEPAPDIDAILKSPLFSYTRQPFVPQNESQLVQITQAISPNPQPISFDHKTFRLLGVLLADGKQKALIARPEVPEGDWLSTNEIIGGWRIVSIEDNRVILSAGESVVEIQQYVDKPKDELAATNNNQ